MAQSSRHAACCVMFSETISREDIREPRIPGRSCVCVVGTLSLDRGWIRVAVRIQRIGNGRLQRLVMCGQRPILQSDADEEPCDTVGMQDERLVASQGSISYCSFRRLVVGTSVSIKVRYIQTSPLIALLIPPNQLLPLTPRLSIRPRRGAVVEDAAI